ncbi:unnamed protein product [Closterium sp. NIES-65]|nr:unnamed protein product [Closterium sp. NIES-65]
MAPGTFRSAAASAVHSGGSFGGNDSHAQQHADPGGSRNAQTSGGGVAEKYGLLAAVIAARGGCAVLDGGLATELELRGADLNDPLWSAKCLMEEEASSLVRKATIEGFTARGLSEGQAEALLARSVQLVGEARDRFWAQHCAEAERRGERVERTEGGVERVAGRVKPLVAASVGSYGAFLADGSEYSGDYGADMTVERLMAFHRRRLQVRAMPCHAITCRAVRCPAFILPHAMFELHVTFLWLLICFLTFTCLWYFLGPLRLLMLPFSCHPLLCRPLLCRPLLCRPLLCRPLLCRPLLCRPLLCRPLLCRPLLCRPLLCRPLLCRPLLCRPLLCRPLLCRPLLCRPLLCRPLLCRPLLCRLCHAWCVPSVYASPGGVPSVLCAPWRGEQVLAAAGPDIIAMETIPCLIEAQALVQLLEEQAATGTAAVPAWISFNSKDGCTAPSGDLFSACIATAAASPHVVAVGINCTPPRFILPLLHAARKARLLFSLCGRAGRAIAAVHSGSLSIYVSHSALFSASLSITSSSNHQLSPPIPSFLTPLLPSLCARMAGDIEATGGVPQQWGGVGRHQQGMGGACFALIHSAPLHYFLLCFALFCCAFPFSTAAYCFITHRSIRPTLRPSREPCDHGLSDDGFVSYAPEWVSAGAAVLGGCCRTTPHTIFSIAECIHCRGEKGVWGKRVGPIVVRTDTEVDAAVAI